MMGMWRKEERQGSFAEQEIYGAAGDNQRLTEIAQLIDWRTLEKELSAVYAGLEGRPAYRPLLMFKALLLQQWYQLSDPGLEEALTDRLSFRRFVGLSLRQRVPDHSTISRFRQQLAVGGLGARLLAEVNRQLEAKHLILKQGTIVDATVVAAAVNPPAGPKGTVAPGTGSALDCDAEWSTRKDGSRRHYHFGYKAHVAVDAGTGLVRKALLTGAKTNESVVADDLICGDEQWLYGDKAYDSAARRALLAKLKIADGIMRRARWGTAHDPSPELRARNKSLSAVRFGIERTFAWLKNWYGLRRMRYRGLGRNGLKLQLICIALNLRRALTLRAA
jgi:transposase, IS5 family